MDTSTLEALRDAPAYIVEEHLSDDEMVLNMGPHHPSTHGVLRLIVATDGEVVRKATPDLGYLHRSIEKIGEFVDYDQFMPYTDRVDYVCAMNSNLAYALAVERLAGIEVPKRAQYLRVLMAELNRISSHLIAVGALAMDMGAFTPFLLCINQREMVNDLFEEVCGARLTYNYLRVGGLWLDLPEGWTARCRKFLSQFDGFVDEFNELITHNAVFVRRLANIGVISRADAIGYGLVGPNLRGSGVPFDLRKDEPYSSYQDFDFQAPVGRGFYGQVGDCFDRFYLRVLELYESARICRQAVDKLDAMPREIDGVAQHIAPKLRTIKCPKGEIYLRTENPRGETGYHLVGDGSTRPLRMRIRTGSFTAMSIFEKLSQGHMIADLVAIIGSLDIVIPEVDR